MGIFDFFKTPDIDQGVIDCKNTNGSILLDVRTKEEYSGGHIPGSINIPLQEISRVGKEIPDKSTPIYSYCLSGVRSSQAISCLRDMGYTAVTNIGGINRYSGSLER
jgi:rhodanese-related sulfurtransferase